MLEWIVTMQGHKLWTEINMANTNKWNEEPNKSTFRE